MNARGGNLDAPMTVTKSATRVLDNRLLHWIGKRAYGIYLVRVLVIYELRHLTSSLSSMGLRCGVRHRWMPGEGIGLPAGRCGREVLNH